MASTPCPTLSNASTAIDLSDNNVTTLDKPCSKWEWKFSKVQNFQDVQLFAVEEFKVEREDLEFFLDRRGSHIPSWKNECIRKFCRGNAQPNLQTGRSSTNPDALPRAWIDSRVGRGKDLKIYTNKLSASALCDILRETVRSAILSCRHTTADL